VQARGLAAQHGLLLLDIIVDGTIRFHLFDLFEPADGTFDGLQIGECAAQPAFGHTKLAAGFRRLFDRLLRLFLGAHEQHTAAFGNRVHEKTARGFELRQCLAEVDDVNPVAGIEDEFFHLGVPTLGLMTKMDARFQQFFNADA